jgi:hypothetical protein
LSRVPRRRESTGETPVDSRVSETSSTKSPSRALPARGRCPLAVGLRILGPASLPGCARTRKAGSLPGCARTWKGWLTVCLLFVTARSPIAGLGAPRTRLRLPPFPASLLPPLSLSSIVFHSCSPSSPLLASCLMVCFSRRLRARLSECLSEWWLRPMKAGLACVNARCAPAAMFVEFITSASSLQSAPSSAASRPQDLEGQRSGLGIKAEGQEREPQKRGE